MSLSDAERDAKIETLEKQVAALKTLVFDLVEKYNWHDHPYDYSRDSNSYDHDATTARPESSGRVDDTDLRIAFESGHGFAVK